MVHERFIDLTERFYGIISHLCPIAYVSASLLVLSELSQQRLQNRCQFTQMIVHLQWVVQTYHVIISTGMILRCLWLKKRTHENGIEVEMPWDLPRLNSNAISQHMCVMVKHTFDSIFADFCNIAWS